MAILKVAQLGNPILRKQAEPLNPQDIQTDNTQILINNMLDTMRDYGGVGLSAPQVHVSRQILLIESLQSKRYPGKPDIPLTVMINPVISVLDKSIIYSWESCLSIPDLWGEVPRYKKLEVTYLDKEANQQTLLASDFFSIVIQHEVDHLNAKVFLDQMTDLSTLCYRDEYLKKTTKR